MHRYRDKSISFTTFTQNGDGTVSFRTQSPYEGEFHDVYTVYPKPGDYGNWNYKCNKEQAASECTSDKVLTAQCLHSDQQFTLVTVFVAGYKDESSAALNVQPYGNDGNQIFSCCPTESEPLNQIQPDHVSAFFTYLIYCGCEDDPVIGGSGVGFGGFGGFDGFDDGLLPSDGGGGGDGLLPGGSGGDGYLPDFGNRKARLLRSNPVDALKSRDEISFAFHNGDLFDEVLKELYGLNEKSSGDGGFLSSLF